MNSSQAIYPFSLLTLEAEAAWTSSAHHPLLPKPQLFFVSCSFLLEKMATFQASSLRPGVRLHSALDQDVSVTPLYSGFPSPVSFPSLPYTRV